MKRLLFGALVALSSCHSWDSDFNLRVVQGFDSGVPGEGGGAAGGGSAAGGGAAGGGNATDGGTTDGGAMDGGATDGGGGVDAGCHPLCLMQTVESGASMRGFIALADGGFLGAGRKYPTASGAQIVLVSQSGQSVSELGLTWSGDVEPHNLAGTSPTDLLLTTRLDIFPVVNGVVTEAGVDCGHQQRPWWGVTRLSADEAWLSGTEGAVCHFTSDAGFVPVKTIADALVDAGTFTDLYGQVVFPNGEAFFVGSGGLLVHVPTDAGAPEISAPASSDFTAVDGPSPADVIAVGSYGQAAQWNGARWAMLPPIGGGRSFTALVHAAEGDAWAVGPASAVVHLTAGGAWELITLPNLDAGAAAYDLKGVSSHGTEDLLISGTRTLTDGTEVGFAWVYRR